MIAWILSNPVTAGIFGVAAALGVFAGVQTARLFKAEADLIKYQATVQSLEADIKLQATAIQTWKREANLAKDRADAAMARAEKFRRKHQDVATRLARADIPQGECAALAYLVDLHMEMAQ